VTLSIDDPTPSDDEVGRPDYDLATADVQAALADIEAVIKDDPKLGPANAFQGEHPKNEPLMLIEDKWGAQGITSLSQDSAAEFSELLVGHRVTKVAKDHLLLDDGTLLRFVNGEGGCSCGAGDYDLTELNGVDNLITAVELVNSPSGDDLDGDGTYKIFVFAGNERINLATYEGTDGNGWYGTGYAVLVRRPDWRPQADDQT